MKTIYFLRPLEVATASLILAVFVGCGGSRSSNESSEASVIRIEGSDTMVNLAQAWAEAYKQQHPDISMQVSGGGSGVGIASLIEGVVDMANASRDMQPKEIQRAEAAFGKKPVEHTVGLDALAVYVHRDNPIETISLEELAEIYGEGGQVTKWSQLGVKNTACTSDEITRVGRQNNSGTYHYFREVSWGISGISSWARSTKADQRTLWPSSRELPVRSGTAAWVITRTTSSG